jgi:hypothetical protein
LNVGNLDDKLKRIEHRNDKLKRIGHQNDKPKEALAKLRSLAWSQDHLAVAFV